MFAHLLHSNSNWNPMKSSLERADSVKILIRKKGTVRTEVKSWERWHGPWSENPDSGQHTVWFSSTYYQDTNVFMKMHILISGNQIPGISWRGWMSRFDGGNQDLSIYRVVSSLSRDWSSLSKRVGWNRNENRLPRNRLDFPLVFNDRIFIQCRWFSHVNIPIV